MPETTGKKRILVVIGTLQHMGGAERQALYLVEHLSRLPEYAVEILAFEDGTVVRRAIDSMGVRVHVVPYYYTASRTKRLAALARIAFVVRTRIKPDALLPFVGMHSKTMGLIWPYSGARFCWWNQQDEGRDLAGTPVEARIVRKMSCITSNSTVGRDFLATTYGLDPKTILVYNNGTPLPDLVGGTALREKLGLGDRQVVSMVASITRFKDHLTLLDAWTEVRDHYRDREGPVLLLAGHLRDAETVAKLKMHAFEHGLSSDDVRFLGPVDDVAELMRLSDVVVHSSLTEGCPNAVCEAMATGRAVVATDIPGCRQALGNDAAEWLAAPRSPHSLASKTIRLLNDESLRDMIGRRNRERIAAEFSIDTMNQFFQLQIEKGLHASPA